MAKRFFRAAPPEVLNLNEPGAQQKLKDGWALLMDRRTIYGNPFWIGRDGTREEVLAKYREYIKMRPFTREELQAVRDTNYVACWCFPFDCHCDIVIKEAMKILPLREVDDDR